MPELMTVASSPRFLPNGVAVSPGGRIFASFPRWHRLDAPSVMEATAEGSFEPYPGDEWNSWQPGLSTEDRIVSAHAVHADAQNHLWVVDDAAPRVAAQVEGAAKLVRIDLDSDQVVRVYPIGADILHPGSMLGHIRVDELCAYVTEAHHGAIIVIDLATGRCLKRLSRDASTRADPAIVPVVEGREFRREDGKVPVLHVGLLELSADGKWLYFAPLLGPVLRRVRTRYLRDHTLSDEDIALHVEDVARIPPIAGIARDAADNLYLSSFTQDAILKMGTDGRIETLVRDPRISFPNEASVGPDGWLYFPASQIHRLPIFGDGVSRVKLPFEVFKVALAP